MPHAPAQSSPAAVPTPATITPALLKTHSVTAEEYARIEAALGRTPSLTELGIFSVMWSEHCSYKSSRVHLRRLPTKGMRHGGPGAVIQGPGENAGIIDVGDGWACAFKIESHNHPSYIEPYQGAATGVGGILRDIFTMGARPMAVMDSLRFGPLVEDISKHSSQFSVLSSQKGLDGLDHTERQSEAKSENREQRTENSSSIDYARNRSTMRGVVHGVGGYGNCFGVPNLGGETRFEECYSGNPLVNAFALGLVRTDEIFYAKAEGVGNPVFYVGAKTGRDGIHGATMASEEFTEGSEQKRPNVQMGDPFLEKLLLEACLEAMKTGAVLGIQDMGAAGLTCSTCEMGARGSLGVTIELDRVPQRETGMTSYEIMLSESQERMLLVAEKGREQEVLDVFAKWDLDCAEVGIVTADDVMRVRHGGVLVAEIPNKALTDDAPLYHRQVGEWKSPVPLDPPAWVLEELKKPRDYTADLMKLLASANICDKRWVYEQYDSMVQTNTVQGPGGEAGVIRVKGGSQGSVVSSQEKQEEHLRTTENGELRTVAVKGSSQGPVVGSQEKQEQHVRTTENGELRTVASPPERGIAMALAGNGRWCYLDPKLGAMHAVAEAARKVACTGAVPVAATNCLNFGNPEKPEIMRQLSDAIDGITEACLALNTPVTGGNVSLYNETKGEAIYPTPVIGIIGLLDDVTKAVPSSFQRAGDAIVLVAGFSSFVKEVNLRGFGSSAYAREILHTQWGTPPPLDVEDDALLLNQHLLTLAHRGLLHSASDISDGGIAVALARGVCGSGLGVEVNLSDLDGTNITHPLGGGEHPAAVVLFSESGSQVILSVDPGNLDDVLDLAGSNLIAMRIGTVTESGFSLRFNDAVIQATVEELIAVYAPSLEHQLAEQVHA